ncbi:MAG: thioesterase family protein [Deltaproteobacteria bacterium]|nr:thioesterase family protein [Deltaproteobacteria bacterium]
MTESTDEATSLVSVSTPTPLDTMRSNGCKFSYQVPDGWQQGRGAFGGLVLAVLTRAMRMCEDDPARSLRSLTAALGGPALVGPAEIQVELLRRGNGLSTLAARLVQDGDVRAHAVGLFAKSRTLDDAQWEPARVPPAPAWESCDVVDVRPPLGPVFASHFEFRPTVGIPFSGQASVCEGWVRARSPGLARDEALLVALADVWWPAALVRASAPRPMATIAFTLQILGDWEGLDPDAPLFHSGQSDIGRDGYFAETRELRGVDGRLMARNTQTMAIIA